MIFTVGHRETYDSGIAKHGEGFMKMGRAGHYVGGSVFETRENAQSYLNVRHYSDYAVYSIDATWDDEHTEQIKREPFRRLLKDARVIKRED